MLAPNRAAIATIAAITALFTVGCESKVSQCNKLTAIANKASAEMQQTSQNSSSKLDQLSTMAGRLDQYSKDISAVEVKDEKLKGFQTRFAQMYQQMSASSQSLVAAVKQKKSAQAKQALTQLQTGVKQESPLISEVNQYCQAK